jgi:ERCC4-type nuclease
MSGWVVDIREPSELISYFKSMGATAEKLPVGDYVYDGMIGFERKGYDFLDFNRMLSQVDELVDAFPFPYLVVEVSLMDIIKESNKIYHRDMLPNITGVIASLCVRGCPPIFCGSQTTMLIIMDKLAKKSVDGKERSMKRILRTRNLDAEDAAVNILRGFDIGTSRAEDISARYGSDVKKILEVMLSSPEELQSIPGIGEGTVKKIKNIIAGVKENEQTIDGKTEAEELF